MRYFTLFLLSLCFMFASTAEATVEQEAAKEFCACVNPVLAKIQKLQETLQSGNTSGIEGMMAELQAMQPKLETCSEDLKKKYSPQEKDKAFQAAVTSEIQKLCPLPKLGNAA